jgi:hypothetical protein
MYITSNSLLLAIFFPGVNFSASFLSRLCFWGKSSWGGAGTATHFSEAPAGKRAFLCEPKWRPQRAAEKLRLYPGRWKHCRQAAPGSAALPLLLPGRRKDGFPRFFESMKGSRRKKILDMRVFIL